MRFLSVLFVFLLISLPVRAELPLNGEMAKWQMHEGGLAAPQSAFRNLAGDEVSLSDFQGKILLVNLWATWCPPCIVELPHLDALQAGLGGEDFQVIAVSVDRGGARQVLPFMAENNLDHLEPWMDKTGEMMKAMQVRSLPVTWLVGSDGRIMGTFNGMADWNSVDARALIRAAMAGKSG